MATPEAGTRPVRTGLAATIVAALLIGACTSGGSSASTWPVDSPNVTVNSPASCAEVGCVGEGVDTSAGSFRSEAEDVLFPPGLYGVSLARSYRSESDRVGWFGRGWSTIYETTLVVDEGDVTIDAPVGLGPLWTPEAPAGWDVVGTPAISQTDGGYALSWPSGEQWAFGGDGGLESVKSPYDATVTIERTSDAVTLASTQGVTVTLGLDDGRVVSADTSDGRHAQYAYVDDLLTGVSAPGIALGYRYDSANLLTEVSTPAGTTTVTYADGKVASQRTAAGDRFTLAYGRDATTVQSTGPEATYGHDAAGRLVGVAYGEADVLVQSFDAEGRLAARTEYAQPGDHVVSSVERTYAGGRLASQTANGVVTTYTYDERGRVTEVAGPSSTSFKYEGDDPLPVAVATPANGRSSIAYGAGFVTSVTDATGVASISIRDAIGNQTGTGTTADALWHYEFDAEGNITTTMSPGDRTWTAQWAPRALLTLERDPLGRVTTYAYDAAGRVVRETAPGGHVTEHAYNEAGQVISVIEPEGFTTRYEYDAAGRTATVVMPGDRSWRMSYDDRPDGSQVVTTTAPDGTAVVTSLDSSGRVTGRRSLEADGTFAESATNTYDFDRLTEAAVRRGRSGLVTTTTYDNAGRVTGVESSLDGIVTRSDSYEYADDRIVAARSGDETASYSYDDAGRLIEVSSGDETWGATYRGGQVAATRHNDDTTDIERDSDGRPVRFVANGVTTSWRYDGADRPISRTVAEAIAQFEWDDADQLTSYDAPTGATWTWAYDTAGRLSSVAEPGGSNTTYEYDLASVSRIRTSGGGRDSDEGYAYDARGQLITAATSSGTYKYEYDAAGRVIAADGPRDNDDESWLVNAAGQVAAVTVDGREYALTYTDTGQIDDITGPNEEFLGATWRDDNLVGVEVDSHDPLGITLDPQGRLLSVAWNSNTSVDLEWQDEASFAIRQRGTDKEFDYTITDGHLAEFVGNGATYSVDDRTGDSIGALSVASDDVDGTVRFDAFGRPATLTTSDLTSTITYDSSGRASSVLTTSPGREPQQATVTYDDGRRVDGNADLVNALFDEAGALKQSLPNALRNPLSAGANSAVLQQALLIDGTETLLVAEPDPFAQVDGVLAASTPSVTTPIGVRDRLRLARQMVVAEVSRLAPTVAINEGLSVQVPIINPNNGELVDYNPFVDAAPSGLALGVLARQAGGGGSLLDRAVDRLGDVVGGVVSFSKDVANFVVTNPVARTVLQVAAVGAAVGCAVAGNIRHLANPCKWVIRVTAAVAFATAIVDVVQSCPQGEIERCGLGVLIALISAAEFVWAGRIAGTTLASVNGRPPINSGYAGKVFEAAGWRVRFSHRGFPRFERFAVARVRLTRLTGGYGTDARLANRAAGFASTPAGHVWHHVEDCKTMLLIPQDLHVAVRHTGGASRLVNSGCPIGSTAWVVGGLAGSSLILAGNGA